MVARVGVRSSRLLDVLIILRIVRYIMMSVINDVTIGILANQGCPFSGSNNIARSSPCIQHAFIGHHQPWKMRIVREQPH